MAECTAINLHLKNACLQHAYPTAQPTKRDTAVLPVRGQRPAHAGSNCKPEQNSGGQVAVSGSAR